MTANADTQDLTVTVDKDLYARLDSLATRIGLSVEEYTANAVAAAMRTAQAAGIASRGVSADCPSRLG